MRTTRAVAACVALVCASCAGPSKPFDASRYGSHATTRGGAGATSDSTTTAAGGAPAVAGTATSRGAKSGKGGASGSSTGGAPARTTTRPNILLVVTDDERVDEQPVMTNTNRLFGAQGTTFNNAFVSTPLCCPSRAAIFSGRYNHNNGVHGNTETEVGHLDLDHTIQRALHDGGYQTGIAGKLFNGWNLDRPPPDFDRYAVMQGGYQNTPFLVDGVKQTVAQYSTDFISDQAASMLDQFQSDPTRPWFLYVAPFAPHFPYKPAAGDENASVGSLPDSPAMHEADLSDKPPWIANYTPSGAARPTGDVWRDQSRSLLDVDRMVKRLMDKDVAPRDTLAIFISDNGYLLGEHGIREDKRIPYTPSVHVPMLMRWPGHVAAGRVDSRFALNVDIAPTIVEASGVGTADLPNLDGHSLLGSYGRMRMLLEGFDAKEFPSDPGWPGWSSMVDRGLQYTEWTSPSGSVIFRELYDRARDPYQLDNLFATDPNVAAARSAPLASALAAQRQCAGTSGPNACP